MEIPLQVTTNVHPKLPTSCPKKHMQILWLISAKNYGKH